MRRRAERLVAPFEGRLWADIPWWARLMIFYLSPATTLESLREWFRQVTALPGDEFYAFARDVQLTVREVKPRRVVCEVKSGCYLYSFDGSRSHPVPCIESVPRSPFGWWVR